MNFAEAADQKARALIRYLCIKSVPAVSKSMGMLLLMYAAWFIFNFIDSSDLANKWTVFAGSLIIIVCGTLILLDFSFNINRTIGLYAIAIGGNRVFKVSNYLSMDTGNETTTALLFIFALFMIGISCNLCYTGYVFLRGETRSRVSMILSSALMMVVTASAVIIIAQLNGTTVIKIMGSYPEYSIMLVMYLILICMLGTETVRLSCRDEHYLSILNGIRKIDASSDKAFIYRAQANILCNAFTDRGTWKKIDDEGPAEAEYKFKLYNRTDDISYVTVQKWKDGEELYFTISDHETGSLFNAYRFSCTGIVPNGPSDSFDRLTFYGKNVQMQIIVKDEPTKKRWGLHV